MNNDDLDALAAEYVLGTLAADERAHAEALIAIDPSFGEIVRQWERRLGELNVMVEAVEPPAELWDKIKSGVGAAAAGNLAPSEVSAPSTVPQVETEAKPEPKSEPEAGSEDLGLIGTPAASLLPPEAEPTGETEAKPEPKPEPQPELKPEPKPSFGYPPQRTPKIDRNADVVYLARRARRWRTVAVLAGAIAAVLAALIVVSQVDPALIPQGGIHIPQLLAQGPVPQPPAVTPPGGRLVAVLQQEPSAPAFLLTVDPASKTLTVRTVSAKEQAGHSYELWLIASPSAKPVALGLVGSGEYTQQPLPADVDADAIRGATYAVSFEPAGGSKTGDPTGPILFTGKLVESAPPPAPPASKT
jgi:anti-sigma-K factor RskA